MAIKSTSANRLIALIAASKMSDEEIQEAKFFLHTTSLQDFLRHVRTARRSLFGEEPAPIAVVASTVPETVLSADVVIQLERLLVGETSLTKAEAVRLLSSVLKRRYPKTEFPEFNSKDGFRRWLNQVAEQVPLGELLHVAASIRNTRVHSQPDDWIDPDSTK